MEFSDQYNIIMFMGMPGGLKWRYKKKMKEKIILQDKRLTQTKVRDASTDIHYVSYRMYNDRRPTVKRVLCIHHIRRIQ